MAFDFPNDLGPRKAKVRYISNVVEPENNDLSVTQRFGQLGSRFAVDVTYPPMRHDRASRLVAALLRAETEETRFLFRQPGLLLGTPGARTVASNVSANATVLPVAGGSVYTVRAAQFFNHVDATGRRRLHATVQPNNIPGNLLIRPPLREVATTGQTLDFATVFIEGFGPRGVSWDVDEAHHYGVSFSIKESK